MKRTGIEGKYCAARLVGMLAFAAGVWGSLPSAYAQTVSRPALGGLAQSHDTRVMVWAGGSTVEALLNWSDSARLYDSLNVDRNTGASRFEERKVLDSQDRTLRIFCAKSLIPYNGQFLHACKVTAMRPPAPAPGSTYAQNEFEVLASSPEFRAEYRVRRSDDLANLNYRLLIGPSSPGNAFAQAFWTGDGALKIELGRWGQESLVSFRRSAFAPF